MGAITKWRGLRKFATAKIYPGRQGSAVLDGGKFRLFMRAITKRLGVAAPTAAPEISLALFEQGRHRVFHCDNGFAHGWIILCGLARKIGLSCAVSRKVLWWMTASARTSA